MKEIKTRPKGKSIKQLDRAAHVLERAKHAAIKKHATIRDKREGGDNEHTASSTTAYAEQRSIVTANTTVRAQMEIGAYIGKRWLRRQLNKRTKKMVGRLHLVQLFTHFDYISPLTVDIGCQWLSNQTNSAGYKAGFMPGFNRILIRTPLQRIKR